MVERKIIQITACQVAEGAITQCEAYLHALCDDGTVWRISNRDIDDGREWQRVPRITPET